MARVECGICGRKVDTTKGNYVFANGIHQHKKCPVNSKLSEQEKKDYRELRDAVDWIYKKKKKPLSPAGWKIVVSQIKELKELGYSYADQLYALKYWVDVKGQEFKGYGIIKYIIEEALLYKKGREELENKKMNNKKSKVEIKFKSKPNYLI